MLGHGQRYPESLQVLEFCLKFSSRYLHLNYPTLLTCTSVVQDPRRKFSLNILVALKVNLYLDSFGFLHCSLSHIDEGTCTLSEEKCIIYSVGGWGKDENRRFPDEERRGKKEHLAFPENGSREGSGPDSAAL